MIKTRIRKLAARWLVEVQSKPEKLENMSLVGVDSNGMRYYSWDKLEDLPRSRYIAIEENTVYIDNKISKTTLAQISQAIIDLNEATIKEKDPKAKSMYRAQISALATEIMFRQKYAVPREVLTSLAAIVTVREDEDPNVFNTQIHKQKSDTFIAEMNVNNCFFLTSPIMKALMPSLIMSEEEWQIHLARLVSQEAIMRERLEIISPKSKSGD